MFGKNPQQKPVYGAGESLAVHSIFATFQGEGPYTGVPAIFIRLSGCNLACSFCDTEFDSAVNMTVSEIISESKQCSLNNENMVVITGGEPLRQPIERLCDALLAAGYRVQIESNGTLYRPLSKAVEIVCSPKAKAGRYYPIRADLWPYIRALKFVISAHDPAYFDVVDVGRERANIPVYVQPMDEYDAVKNAANLARARHVAHQRGAILSLQTHKLAQVA